MSTSRIFARWIGTFVVAITMLISLGTGVHAQAVSTGTPPGSPFVMDGTLDDDNGDNVTGGAVQVKKDDPDGNSQELGPANTSDNKINPINTATTPMLGFTNPNGQVDLGGVWVETANGTGTHANETFLYLAWERPDSSTGSGQIGYEFFHSALPSECVYTGVNFVKPPGNQQPNQATQDLIADCNPWVVRQDGDFFINWDQAATPSKNRISRGGPSLARLPALLIQRILQHASSAAPIRSMTTTLVQHSAGRKSLARWSSI